MKPIAHTLVKTKRILDALSEKPMTVWQLADGLFMSPSSVFKYLKRMRTGEPRTVHVQDFEPAPGRPRPIYAAGSLPDAQPKKPRRVRKSRAKGAHA